MLLLDHSGANVTFHQGDLGIAVLAAETSTLGKLTQHGGTCEMGEVTLTEVERNEGELTGELVTMSGTLVVRN